jgi:hypothetical protein
MRVADLFQASLTQSVGYQFTSPATAPIIKNVVTRQHLRQIILSERFEGEGISGTAGDSTLFVNSKDLRIRQASRKGEN